MAKDEDDWDLYENEEVDEYYEDDDDEGEGDSNSGLNPLVIALPILLLLFLVLGAALFFIFGGADEPMEPIAALPANSAADPVTESIPAAPTSTEGGSTEAASDSPVLPKVEYVMTPIEERAREEEYKKASLGERGDTLLPLSKLDPYRADLRDSVVLIGDKYVGIRVRPGLAILPCKTQRDFNDPFGRQEHMVLLQGDADNLLSRVMGATPLQADFLWVSFTDPYPAPKWRFAVPKEGDEVGFFGRTANGQHTPLRFGIKLEPGDSEGVFGANEATTKYAGASKPGNYVSETRHTIAFCPKKRTICFMDATKPSEGITFFSTAERTADIEEPPEFQTMLARPPTGLGAFWSNLNIAEHSLDSLGQEFILGEPFDKTVQPDPLLGGLRCSMHMFPGWVFPTDASKVSRLPPPGYKLYTGESTMWFYNPELAGKVPTCGITSDVPGAGEKGWAAVFHQETIPLRAKATVLGPVTLLPDRVTGLLACSLSPYTIYAMANKEGRVWGYPSSKVKLDRGMGGTYHLCKPLFEIPHMQTKPTLSEVE